MDPHSTIEDIYRLTPLQEGMLFASLQAPESNVYVEHAVYRVPRIEGALYDAAWQEVIAHYGILRTGFAIEGIDQPLQVVHRSVSCPVEEIDFSSLSASDRRTRLDAPCAADGVVGFDLRKPPLVPGSHMNMIFPPNIEILAEKLRVALLAHIGARRTEVA